MSDINLTKEEQQAVNSLSRLAEKWPKSLWLFSNDQLCVMKNKDDGTVATNTNGSYDSDYIVGTINGRR